MTTIHTKTAVTTDDPSVEVGSDEWNEAHSTSLSGGEVMLQQERFSLASDQRLTIIDVARLRLLEATDGIRGSYNAGSQDVVNDNWMLQYKRTGLLGSARLRLFGTGELYVFDLAPVGRLILAGRGL